MNAFWKRILMISYEYKPSNDIVKAMMDVLITEKLLWSLILKLKSNVHL